MEWVTRQDVHIDRVACAWLILRFIDPEAEFTFVPADTDPAKVQGIAFDMRGAELGHHHGKCTFEVMLDRYGLTQDPGLVRLGVIVHGADIPLDIDVSPMSAGLEAIARGFMLLEPDDMRRIQRQRPLYDALYAYCSALPTPVEAPRQPVPSSNGNSTQQAPVGRRGGQSHGRRPRRRNP
ncbi:MAG: chromate resistance protein ChrB domain-containing protein [Bacillota bacterium]